MIHQKRQQEIIPDVVLLLEHSPCITLGRSGGYDNLLADNSVLQQHGITVHETSRGGNITYHGPGQLVCYPILSLAGEERDLHAYARKMEEVMIRTVSAFGIKASRRAGFPGVWTKEAKIGAIGVAVDKWVTMHGMSLNVCPDLNHFSFIVPCGIATNGVTSMEKLMGPSIDINRVRHEMRNQFCEIFQISMRSEELEYII
jgi:lipoate-protein ligase B